MSPEHLHRYTAEFTFRFNTREFEEKYRFLKVIENSKNIRLDYKTLINSKSKRAGDSPKFSPTF